MQISSKTEYAVRAITELALISETGVPVSLKLLCEKQGLPLKYIEKLFRKLKDSKIINSTKGSKGGYILLKKPEEITLLEIMDAVEEKYSTVLCERPTTNTVRCDNSNCGFYRVWKGLQNDMKDYFAKITIEKFIKEIRR